MTLSDTRIHQIELLLTLDYLLNHTDENHPATQIDICNYAKKYGLKFDKNALSGNQVRRQRIGECLRFLKDVSDRFPNDVPFVLEITDSGKYYIEQRNGLDENQVAKILAAIKNDKYTKDEDVDFLQKRILSAFSTDEENKKLIEIAYKSLIRDGKKYDRETLSKIDLVEKAYREGKLIKIQQESLVLKSPCFFWYRVYLIREFHDELYALLLPIGPADLSKKYYSHFFSKEYLFDSIERLPIANGTPKNILCDDLDEKRDFNELFLEKCPFLAKRYGNIENWLENELFPSKNSGYMVTFCFRLEQKEIIKHSFERYFSEDMFYQVTSFVKGLEDQNGKNQMTFPKTSEKEKQKYGLVNCFVNRNLFHSWLLSDPFNEGQRCIADLIQIIKPTSLKLYLANHFAKELMGRTGFLMARDREDLLSELFVKITTFQSIDDFKRREIQKMSLKEEDISLQRSITRILDRGFLLKKGVVISGLKGSRKTQIVKQWLSDNKDKLNGYYIDGVKLSIFSGPTRNRKDLILSGQIFDSETIDMLSCLPHRVIVIDNYHMLSDDIQSHILLLCDGYVVDNREKTGFKKLSNLDCVYVIKERVL